MYMLKDFIVDIQINMPHVSQEVIDKVVINITECEDYDTAQDMSMDIFFRVYQAFLMIKHDTECSRIVDDGKFHMSLKGL